MTTATALLLSIFQEQDARTFERKQLNQILDKNNSAEGLYIV